MSLVAKRLSTHSGPWQHRKVSPLGLPVTTHGSPTQGIVNGHDVVLAGTNNYLGLTFHPACIEASVEAARKYGTGTTGSRMANGTYPEHLLLEQELGDFYGARSAMIFTTGYQANLGMISGLATHDSALLLDADCHASIYDGARMSGARVFRFKHNDPADLERKLRRLGERTTDTLIVAEGIYSMLGDLAPLEEFCALATAHGATLLVDEAHSLGVLGDTGRGLAEALDVESQIDFIVGTFSKSLGCVGGFCVSRRHDLDALRAGIRPYVFSASMPPSVIASARAALAVIRSDPTLREKLWANSRRVYQELEALGFELGPDVSPVVAVIMRNGDDALDVWNFLLEHGVYVNLIGPPASPGSMFLLRCSLSAAHTAEQIDTILAAFRQLAESAFFSPQP